MEACAGGHEAEADVALDLIRQTSRRGHRHRADGAEEDAEEEEGREERGEEEEGKEEDRNRARGPSVAGLASAVSACAKAGRVEEGLLLLHRLEREGPEEGNKLARALHAPLIAACARARGEAAADTALLLLRVSRRTLARSRG